MKKAIDRYFHVVLFIMLYKAGADPGEVKWVNFHPPFSEPPSFFFLFSYPSNIEIIFDFSYIITEIHPHFKILDPPLYVYICIRLLKYTPKTLQI